MGASLSQGTQPFRMRQAVERFGNRLLIAEVTVDVFDLCKTSQAIEIARK